MPILNAELQTQLVEIITDEFGADLTRDDFTESALSMFEDIAGLDLLNQRDQQRLINDLWRLYRG